MPSKTRGRDWDAAPNQKKATTPIKIVDDSGIVTTKHSFLLTAAD